MKVVKSYDENGYHINEYDTGTIEKFLIGADKPLETEPEITLEEMVADVQINTEYIACLTEINNN